MKIFLLLLVFLFPSIFVQAQAWQKSFDFDGDQQPDFIDYEFSGGAHCCYRISITLSSNSQKYQLPFWIDGGYIGGLNLSRPSHFNIADYDGDGLPDIFLEFSTYNGIAQPLNSEEKHWLKRFRAHSRCLEISFLKNELKIRDLRSADVSIWERSQTCDAAGVRQIIHEN